MKSFYSAYKAYENRVIRGEMDGKAGKIGIRPDPYEVLLTQLGDLFIQAGMRLKRQRVAGKPIAWLSMTGSKP